MKHLRPTAKEAFNCEAQRIFSLEKVYQQKVLHAASTDVITQE